jgi:drug/metabolite transporter (DMT)-like permease
MLRWLIVLCVLVVIARRPLLRLAEAAPPAAHRRNGHVRLHRIQRAVHVAAHHTSAINLGILQAVMPIFIFMIAFVRFRTPVTLLQGAGVIAAVLGVTLVAARGDWQNLLATQFNEGDLIMIGVGALRGIRGGASLAAGGLALHSSP